MELLTSRRVNLTMLNVVMLSMKNQGEYLVTLPSFPLADVVLGSPELNFSAALVNSQLVCLPPVGILNSLCCI